jgi:hypothetical protein
MPRSLSAFEVVMSGSRIEPEIKKLLYSTGARRSKSKTLASAVW